MLYWTTLSATEEQMEKLLDCRRRLNARLPDHGYSMMGGGGWYITYVLVWEEAEALD